MIESFETMLLTRRAGDRVLVTREAATLPCGCRAYVGWIGNEAGLAATACGREHLTLVDEFPHRYRLSLADPLGDPAVEVADRILAEVATGWGIAL